VIESQAGRGRAPASAPVLVQGALVLAAPQDLQNL